MKKIVWLSIVVILGLVIAFVVYIRNQQHFEFKARSNDGILFTVMADVSSLGLAGCNFGGIDNVDEYELQMAIAVLAAELSIKQVFAYGVYIEKAFTTPVTKVKILFPDDIEKKLIVDAKFDH